jgi:predicted ribonuclease YlaK
MFLDFGLAFVVGKFRKFRQTIASFKLKRTERLPLARFMVACLKKERSGA